MEYLPIAKRDIASFERFMKQLKSFTSLPGLQVRILDLSQWVIIFSTRQTSHVQSSLPILELAQMYPLL